MSTDLAGLRSYQQRRLDLADIARALLHVTRRHGDSQREADVRSLLTRLASDRFRLAVAGQFSRGKSTLMNALLGGSYLPMGTLPMTSVVTTVRYGTRPRALVRAGVTGLPMEVPVSELARFVARQGADRARRRVSSVEVEVPAEFLRLGFEFVDTPGLGSAVGAGAAATLDFLPGADSVLLVTSFDSALSEAETTFLRTAAEGGARLFVVINKLDLVTPDEAAEVQRFARSWLRENLPGPHPPVFAVCALAALTTATDGAATAAPSGGVGELRGALTTFLTRERGVVALTSVGRAVLHLLSLQHRDLRAGLLPEHGDRTKARLEAELAAAVEQDLGVLAQRAALFTERAARCTQELFAARAGQWTDELVSAVSDETRDSGQACAEWLEHRAGELQDHLISRLAADITAIIGLVRSPRATGAGLAGLTPAGPEEADARWSAGDLPVLPAPVIRWEAPEPGKPGRPRRRSRAPGSELERAALTRDAAARLADRAAAAFGDLADQWSAALADQSAGRTRDEADQFLRYLRDSPDAGELQTVADLRERTACLLDFLPISVPDEPDESVHEVPAAAPESATGTDCAVCRDLQAALTELLTRHQYLLASDERTQARHAAAGGFCSLHTWQYAQIASPVGISSGYAALASGIAGAVRRLHEQAATPRELGQKLTGLTACAACAAVASAEAQAVADLARLPAGDLPGGPLCLRHVTLVLQAGCSAGVAAQIIRTFDSTLRRLASDMREYSLKREALRRSLITAAEADAYSTALRLLAGPPALARPWSELSSR